VALAVTTVDMEVTAVLAFRLLLDLRVWTAVWSALTHVLMP
jgi:hypothetical protein